jgi:hypothetical protein
LYADALKRYELVLTLKDLPIETQKKTRLALAKLNEHQCRRADLALQHVRWFIAQGDEFLQHKRYHRLLNKLAKQHCDSRLGVGHG